MINRVPARFRPALVRSVMPGVIMAFMVLIAACSFNDSDAAPTVTPVPRAASVASLDEGVSLAPGEAVEITDEGVAFAFHRVAEESRCPAGAECVTAGTAIVVMSLIQATGEANQLEFIVSQGGDGIVVAGPYTVTLKSLEPDPPPKGGVDDDDYQITFTVSRQ